MRLSNYAYVSGYMYYFGMDDECNFVYNVFPSNDCHEKVVEAGGYYSLGYITGVKNVPYVKPSEAQILKYKEESDEKCKRKDCYYYLTSDEHCWFCNQAEKYDLPGNDFYTLVGDNLDQSKKEREDDGKDLQDLF